MSTRPEEIFLHETLSLTYQPADAMILGQGEDFRFYKSGVYDQKKCSPKLKRLDHAVIVSGCALAYIRCPCAQSIVWLLSG